MPWYCVKIGLPCQYLLSFTSGTCEDSKQTFLPQEHGKYQDMPNYRRAFEEWPLGKAAVSEKVYFD